MFVSHSTVYNDTCFVSLSLLEAGFSLLLQNEHYYYVSAQTKGLGDFSKGVSIAIFTRRTMLLCFADNKGKEWTRQCHFAADANKTYYYSSAASLD